MATLLTGRAVTACRGVERAPSALIGTLVDCRPAKQNKTERRDIHNDLREDDLAFRATVRESTNPETNLLPCAEIPKDTDSGELPPCRTSRHPVRGRRLTSLAPTTPGDLRAVHALGHLGPEDGLGEAHRMRDDRGRDFHQTPKTIQKPRLPHKQGALIRTAKQQRVSASNHSGPPSARCARGTGPPA